VSEQLNRIESLLLEVRSTQQQHTRQLNLLGLKIDTVVDSLAELVEQRLESLGAEQEHQAAQLRAIAQHLSQIRDQAIMAKNERQAQTEAIQALAIQLSQIQ